jgi:preprotein translocase subunit SecD
MSKKKVYTVVSIIFVLAVAAAVLDYPALFNKSADYLNDKISLGVPHVGEVPFKLGLDLQGGTHLVYEADLSELPKEEHGSSMQGLRDVIERRVNLFGVEEPVVQIQETDRYSRLIVELAGIKDPAQAIEMIGQTPFLEFKEPKENYQEIAERNQKIYDGEIEGEIEDPFEPTLLTGKYLEKAEPTFDQTTYQPQVSLKFNSEGAELFEEITSRNVGKPLAIYIDGIPLSAPTVQEAISRGEAVITGSFTIEEVQSLSRNLNAGALPVPINLISQQSVGPTLGAISLEKSLKAGMWGLLAVLIFMVVFYRMPGLLASLSLAIYVALVLALFKLIPVTLTLAGIGGFILSIGMAIDANILIFSRMREELRSGQSFSTAVEEGFKRAWPSIRDGNLTTLIVALILFGFGTSFVKGFAFTLTLGILMSMFSAIIITKNLLRVFAGTKLERIKILWH